MKLTLNRRSSPAKSRGLTLGRRFLSRTKSTDSDSARNPKTGDLLKLEGFGGDLFLNNGQAINLQTLVNISVSGVIIFTYPRTQTSGIDKQAFLFRDAYQKLTNGGFGVYGLSRDTPRYHDSLGEKVGLPVKHICDEKGTLVSALGLDRGSREPIRGVVAIGKDGRVLVSTAGGPHATLEAVAPLVQTLSVFERTPTQEYNGQGYFVRTPTSPLPPSVAQDEGSGYFSDMSLVSPSMASLHSYLQQMDSSKPAASRTIGVSRRPQPPSRAPSS